MHDIIKKMEISKELYSEALEITRLLLSEDEAENIKGYKLEADFTSKHFFDTSDIIREYKRRELNAMKPLKQLLEQDKNIYRFIFTKGDILEMKYKCLYCKYIENENKVIVANSDELNIITIKNIDDVESVVCIERNNNLDYRQTINELSDIINFIK